VVVTIEQQFGATGLQPVERRLRFGSLGLRLGQRLSQLGGCNRLRAPKKV
jgi:hypothetical protein